MRSRRETYAHLLPEEFFARHTAEQAAKGWARKISGATEDESINVATVDEHIVGFASSGPSRDLTPVRTLELYGIYLLAAHHGSGIGQRLLDVTIGNSPASLWVAKHNPRARAFYLRNGFRPDGEEMRAESWDNLELVRLVR